ncbi:MAG TPA: site-specific integrase, partial [Streptosporangiaceae bacterium]
MADDHVVVPLTGRSSLAAVQETDVDPMTESISDFALFLRAEGKSPYTIKKYCEAVRRLHRYAVERGAKDWTSVTKPMIRAWLATIGDVQQQAAHVSAMQSGAKSFFNFLEDEEWEGTGRQSPMRKMPCPKVNRPVIDVLTQDKLAAIIAKCKGSPRDEAIVR